MSRLGLKNVGLRKEREEGDVLGSLSTATKSVIDVEYIRRPKREGEWPVEVARGLRVEDLGLLGGLPINFSPDTRRSICVAYMRCSALLLCVISIICHISLVNCLFQGFFIGTPSLQLPSPEPRLSLCSFLTFLYGSSKTRPSGILIDSFEGGLDPLSVSRDIIGELPTHLL